MAKMDEMEFHAIVRGEIEQSVNYHDTELQKDRIDAMNYYLGEPLGNEQEGRSTVISTETSDTIEMLMPSLMRVFTTTNDFVRFAPRGPEDVEAAKQASEYVNFILNNDNDGFVVLHNWFKDALLFKLGVVKHYYDESEKVIEDVYEGLTESELTVLFSDDDVEILEQDIRVEGEDVVDEMGNIIQPALELYDVKVKKTTRNGRVRIENVPPEEFLFNQHAKSLDDCRFTAHRTTMTVSELVEMGYDRDVVENHVGANELDNDNERLARFENLENTTPGSQSSDSTQHDVLVTEVYIRSDYDGDGTSELRRVVCLGDSYTIVENEPFFMMPFSVLSPILMPHRMVGRSFADLVKDLQQIKTALTRQLLDNVYQTNNARIAAVEGQVNLDDLINSRPGGIVRMRAPNMVQPIAPPSVSDTAMPMLAYMDEVREQRTGLSKASMGLDPDALQSSTATAVAATVSAAQSKLEMIARVFAETGVKRLMSCILEIVQKNQQQPRMVRLRNTFVTMDPQAWENEFDIEIEVGLGTAQVEQRIAVLMQIAEKQEQILLQTGINNPLVTLSQYRNTLTKAIELSGFKDTSAFFMDPDNLPPEVQQQMQQQTEQSGVDPEIEMERMKAQAEIELKREKMMAELELKREEMQMKMQLRQQEMQMEAQLRGIEAQVGGSISDNLPRTQ